MAEEEGTAESLNLWSWITVFNDCQLPSWACLRELGWWGSCPFSRTIKDFLWDLFIPTHHPDSSWLCLSCWQCILKGLYWLRQLHLATQSPGCARCGSPISSCFSVLCTVSHCYIALSSFFPPFFSCWLTWFALCCCFLCSCWVVSALPAPSCGGV